MILLKWLFILLALIGLVVYWLKSGRYKILDCMPAYQRALDLLDRCKAIDKTRRVQVDLSRGACLTYDTWRDVLSGEQIQALANLAVKIQELSLGARRELAGVIMEAGHVNPWLRFEILQVVGRAEALSAPDFILEYHDHGSPAEMRIPVLSVYLNERG